LVDGDDGNATGNTIDGGTFDFAEYTRADLVRMDMEDCVSGTFASSREDILSIMGGTDFFEEGLEFDKRLD